MKKAIFITGFNYWGKSTIITSLFDRLRFYQGWAYQVSQVPFNTQFTVESNSNDDWWGQNWIERLEERINNSPDDGQNVFTALCPTMHANNNFVELLNLPLFGDYQKYIFLIEYKFEHHAKLDINYIINTVHEIPNSRFVVINADQNLHTVDERLVAKLIQIRQELNNIYTI